MVTSRLGLTYHHVLTAPQIRIPPRAKPGISESSGPANLIRIRERFSDPLSVLRRQIRMSFSDMTLLFLGQLDLPLQVRAGKLGHHASRFNMHTS